MVYDRKFTGLEAHHGKWLLHFKNYPDATADFVIGANGGLSTARNQVTDTEVENTGIVIIQGEVSKPETKWADFSQLCDGNILLIAYKGNQLVANPSNNGVLTYNVIFGKPEEWVHDAELNFQNTDGVISYLFDRFSQWAEPYKQLFRTTSAFWGLPTRKMPFIRQSYQREI